MSALTAQGTVEKRTLFALSEIFRDCSLDQVGIRLWNGTRWPDERPRVATLVLQRPDSLAKMFLPGTEVGLAEAYLRNDFDVEGDLEAAFEIADFLLARRDSWKSKLRLSGAVLAQPGTSAYAKLRAASAFFFSGALHSRERDRQAAAFHYDLSNEFYELWLDKRMVYSCAYFESPDDSLDAAQEQKLNYLCRKLRLRPGQQVLDIGCGWGGLIIHAAKNFGARALGITLSERQAELARDRIAAAGLRTQATVEVRDYRDLPATDRERYDAIVSAGMAEHVGRERLSDYFKAAHRALKPRGILLNQAIGESVVARPDNKNGSFIDDYVFPDGDTPPLPLLFQSAEAADFEIRDVENLREHYALTLRHWLRRLEMHHTKALAFVDEATYRIWRLYLAGSAYGFRRGQLAVYQTLLAKADQKGETTLPLTRADWYRESRTN